LESQLETGSPLCILLFLWSKTALAEVRVTKNLFREKIFVSFCLLGLEFITICLLFLYNFCHSPKKLTARAVSPFSFWFFRVLLKLILFHQESRTLENHNMFKFRALLGEACLHKKGKQQTYLKCTAQYV
jgi:hypothetical protein